MDCSFRIESPPPHPYLAAGGVMIRPARAAALTLLLAPAAPALAGDAFVSAPEPASAPRPPISRTILFPILLQAPVFGADVTLPSVDLPGGGTIRPAGSTTSSLNAAAFAGFRMDRENWLLEINGLYAGLSSERTLPRVTVDTNFKGGTATFGWRVYKDFLLMAGVRRMGLRVTATVEDFDSIRRTPGLWDPLVGVTWRGDVSRKWTLEAEFQGGGFGVGTDVDLAGTFTADWRFVDRFGLRLGYSVLHFKLSETKLGKTFETSQTLQGPAIGL